MNISKCLLTILCKLGFHKYDRTPVLVYLDSYWLQGGEECSRCCHKTIIYEDAGILAHIAYTRGKLAGRNNILAYGRGIKEIEKLYGREYIINMLDKNVSKH